MKLLQIKIASCFECPDYRTPHDDKVKIDWCYSAARKIENIRTVPIPEWCPLPDEEVKSGT